ncbi:MAG: hypothetical protein NTV52_01165 [Acidobacteria bacterium]|nr:hypothetical protein [Acidobacteriota bacterium]
MWVVAGRNGPASLTAADENSLRSTTERWIREAGARQQGATQQNPTQQIPTQQAPQEDHNHG